MADVPDSIIFADGPAGPDSRREILDEMLFLGADLARRLHRRAVAQIEAGEEPSAVAQFDRVSRCVRRTILLTRKLEDGPTLVVSPDRVTARKRVIRAVEDAIDRVRHDDADALRAELGDRLDAPELDEEIGWRPLPEIIAEICRDLGVSSDGGMRRRPGDVAALCVRAARGTPGVRRQTPGEAGRPAGCGPPG